MRHKSLFCSEYFTLCILFCLQKYDVIDSIELFFSAQEFKRMDDASSKVLGWIKYSWVKSEVKFETYNVEGSAKLSGGSHFAHLF